MGGEGGDAGFEFGINPNDDPEPRVSGGRLCMLCFRSGAAAHVTLYVAIGRGFAA